MKSPVFLSASIPYREPYVSRCDPMAIREAVLALVSVTVRERLLVFGGHPAISPLVEQAARSLGAVGNVHIFQSRWFEERISPEAREFQNFHWTEPGDSLQNSLDILRRTMITYAEFSVGVFIGGMEGVIDECNLFRRLLPGAKLLPVASTGAAAADLWEKAKGRQDLEETDILQSSRRYRAWFRTLLPE